MSAELSQPIENFQFARMNERTERRTLKDTDDEKERFSRRKQLF